MRLVKTRFRDISAEELLKSCPRFKHPDYQIEYDFNPELWEREGRGKAVTVDLDDMIVKCGEACVRAVEYDGNAYKNLNFKIYCCQHEAELD